MAEVRGVILDSSALLLPHPTPSLRPGADSLLRILQFSQLRLGISYESTLSNEKVSLLRKMAIQYSFDCFGVSSSNDAIEGISSTWGDIGGNILYTISHEKEDLFTNLCSYGWLLAVLSVDGSSCGVDESSSVSYISKLEELPLNIIRLNKKTVGSELVTVGYVMKPSRQSDFAKRGALPMHSTQNGLIFLPLTYELDMPSQLRGVDVVLHKATDDILSIELTDASKVGPRITYTQGLQELRRSLDQQQNCCVIDPFDNILPVLDRREIQHLLLGITELCNEGQQKIRGPHFLKVNKFGEPNLREKLSEAMLSLPNIVKPQVACGVADAHSMAIIFKFDDYVNLSVPVPAIVQEYVDHSSTIFKIYVLGTKVFHAVKKSTPNACVLMEISEPNQLRPLLFDSLKSLPTAMESGNEAQIHFDFDVVKKAANWLQRQLHLTLFGFDVVVQEGTGDHVIVDVNYLPSFKEVPDNVAVPAFWEAIKNKFEEKPQAK